MGDEFRVRYGPAALVAGASEGLGEAFATALARRGMDLVLVARREDRLARVASRLTEMFGVTATPLAADLGHEDACSLIAERTAGDDIGLVIYNAAASAIAPFLDAPMHRHRKIVDVNVVGATSLVHHFGRRMVDRGGGGIVLMTSLSAFQGSARIASYAASKAYLLALAEALSYELDSSGVDVLASCAGATRTPNYLSSRPRKAGLLSAPEMDADVVVTQTLAALGRKTVVIPGALNRLSHVIMHRLLPRRLAVRIMGRTMDRLYASTDLT